MRSSSLLISAAAAFALTSVVAGAQREVPSSGHGRPVVPIAPRRGASPPSSGAAVPMVTHPAWSRTATMYEVNVRSYTPEGTLAALQPHLRRIRALGVDVLWIMPVNPIGRKNRKGPLGSPYSVSDYHTVNPEFGTKADFVRLVDAAHAQGMKVILDWVPNHTSFDHAWITQQPGWYVHRADGSIINARDNDNHDTDWTDVAELNYDDPHLRQAMIGEMRYWLDVMKIDGFRCDVAGGVPEDFWRDARTALGAGHPGLFMLAEAEGPQYYDAFDMTYGWSLWDLFADVSKGKKPVSSFARYFAHADSTYPADAYRLDFTSNHDKNSWDGTEFESMGANETPSYVLAATVSRSMPLLYTGQEVSNKKRLRFFARDTVNWAGPSRAEFYRAVFALKHTQPALANGAAGGPQQTLAMSGDTAQVFAFTRTRGPNTVLVAVNYGDADARVAYQGLGAAGAYVDWFTKTPVTLGASGAMVVPAHGYRVLVQR